MLNSRSFPSPLPADVPSRRPAQIIRRSTKFWPLWLAAVGVPMFILAATAWWSWNLERFEARSALVRTVDLLREHALRSFDKPAALLIAAQGYTATMSWDEIAKSRAVADFLHDLDEGAPDLGAIGIVAPDGSLLHHSRVSFPLPRTTDLSDRDYFAAQQGSSAGIYVGQPIVGRLDGQPAFSYSRPRRDINGQPDGGVLWAAFSPSGFANFYATVVQTPADTVALVRNDGVLLARYPPLSRLAGHQLPLDSAPMKAARAATSSTAFAEGESPFDGKPRLYAARQLGNLPLSVIYGLHADSLRLDWLRDLRINVVATAVAMAFLLVLTWLVTRRARREEAALERARVEAELRAEAEAALRRGQRLEILGQIAAGVAHDFRNVVHTVRGGLELVHRALDNGDLARAKVVVDMVAETAKHGEGLTKRMLRVAAKPPAGRDDPAKNVAPSDPVSVVHAVGELLKSTIGGNCTVQVQVEPAGVPRRVRGEPAELEAALLNLALNARDAMPAGGVVLISLASEDVLDSDPLHPEGLRPGRYARIAVSDTGVGMDSATLARAAEPFFTTKSAERGTGLGLSTARAFARGAGGALRIASAGPGHGTVATLWLPS